MILGKTQIDGWFFTDTWNYYQRCEGNVVAYIEEMTGFYRLHVTIRGNLGVCDIEYRNESFVLSLQKAHELLEKYKDAEKEDLEKDFYSPWNPEGFWQKVYPVLKEYDVYMCPKQVNDKWWIEVSSDRIGRVFLLDKEYKEIPVPVMFESEEEAFAYILTLDLAKY